MTFLPTGPWRYAIFLMFLLAIVAWAAYSVIHDLEGLLPDKKLEQTTLLILSLTMGCLFLSGALGVWAIRSAAESESRKRLGRFVDAMDYLGDGLVLVEKKGVITGANPAINAICGREVELGRTSLRDAFPELSDEDFRKLMNPGRTYEVERETLSKNGIRVLRFRSQHSQGMRLVLVSDVTAMKSLEMRRRQAAQLHVIGRIAAGVAHDFNNILCAVAGHAALIKRSDDIGPLAGDSLDVIMRETERGSRLSRQLLELSRTGTADKPCGDLPARVEEAANLLKIALSPAWTVKTEIRGEFPPVPLSGVQVEQVVVNLGMVSADVQPSPGTLAVTLTRPGDGPLADVGEKFAAVIIVSAEAALAETAEPQPGLSIAQQAQSLREESGAIPSVVSSIVAEVGGRLDVLTGPAALSIYRVALPSFADSSSMEEWISGISEVKSRFDSKFILLACPQNKAEEIDDLLAYCGAIVERKDDMLGVFAAAQLNARTDGMILHASLLAAEKPGLLMALRKLCPRAGIVVLAGENERNALQEDYGPAVHIASENSGPDGVALRLAAAMSAASGNG